MSVQNTLDGPVFKATIATSSSEEIQEVQQTENNVDTDATCVNASKLLEIISERSKSSNGVSEKGSHNADAKESLLPFNDSFRTTIRAQNGNRQDTTINTIAAKTPSSDLITSEVKEVNFSNSHSSNSKVVGTYEEKSQAVSTHEEKSQAVSTHEEVKSQAVSTHEEVKSQAVSTHEEKSQAAGTHEVKSQPGNVPNTFLARHTLVKKGCESTSRADAPPVMVTVSNSKLGAASLANANPNMLRILPNGTLSPLFTIVPNGSTNSFTLVPRSGTNPRSGQSHSLPKAPTVAHESSLSRGSSLESHSSDSGQTVTTTSKASVQNAAGGTFNRASTQTRSLDSRLGPRHSQPVCLVLNQHLLQQPVASVSAESLVVSHAPSSTAQVSNEAKATPVPKLPIVPPPSFPIIMSRNMSATPAVTVPVVRDATSALPLTLQLPNGEKPLLTKKLNLATGQMSTLLLVAPASSNVQSTHSSVNVNTTPLVSIKPKNMAPSNQKSTLVLAKSSPNGLSNSPPVIIDVETGRVVERRKHLTPVMLTSVARSGQALATSLSTKTRDIASNQTIRPLPPKSKSFVIPPHLLHTILSQGSQASHTTTGNSPNVAKSLVVSNLARRLVASSETLHNSGKMGQKEAPSQSESDLLRHQTQTNATDSTAKIINALKSSGSFSVKPGIPSEMNIKVSGSASPTPLKHHVIVRPTKKTRLSTASIPRRSYLEMLRNNSPGEKGSVSLISNKKLETKIAEKSVACVITQVIPGKPIFVTSPLKTDSSSVSEKVGATSLGGDILTQSDESGKELRLSSWGTDKIHKSGAAPCKVSFLDPPDMPPIKALPPKKSKVLTVPLPHLDDDSVLSRTPLTVRQLLEKNSESDITDKCNFSDSDSDFLDDSVTEEQDLQVLEQLLLKDNSKTPSKAYPGTSKFSQIHDEKISNPLIGVESDTALLRSEICDEVLRNPLTGHDYEAQWKTAPGQCTDQTDTLKATPDKLELKIESVFSLQSLSALNTSADAIADHSARIGEGTMCSNSPESVLKTSVSHVHEEHSTASPTHKPSPAENIITSCFSVLERLSDSDIERLSSPANHQVKKIAKSQCSEHCRKRTLRYLCDLNLLPCDPYSFSASPLQDVDLKKTSSSYFGSFEQSYEDFQDIKPIAKDLVSGVSCHEFASRMQILKKRLDSSKKRLSMQSALEGPKVKSPESRHLDTTQFVPASPNETPSNSNQSETVQSVSQGPKEKHSRTVQSSSQGPTEKLSDSKQSDTVQSLSQDLQEKPSDSKQSDTVQSVSQDLQEKPSDSKQSDTTHSACQGPTEKPSDSKQSDTVQSVSQDLRENLSESKKSDIVQSVSQDPREKPSEYKQSDTMQSVSQDPREKLSESKKSDIVQSVSQNPIEKLSDSKQSDTVQSASQDPREKLSESKKSDIVQSVSQNPIEKLSDSKQSDTVQSVSQDPREKLSESKKSDIVQPVSQNPIEKLSDSKQSDTVQSVSQDPREKLSESKKSVTVQSISQEPKQKPCGWRQIDTEQSVLERLHNRLSDSKQAVKMRLESQDPKEKLSDSKQPGTIQTVLGYLPDKPSDSKQSVTMQSVSEGLKEKLAGWKQSNTMPSVLECLHKKLSNSTQGVKIRLESETLKDKPTESEQSDSVQSVNESPNEESSDSKQLELKGPRLKPPSSKQTSSDGTHQTAHTPIVLKQIQTPSSVQNKSCACKGTKHYIKYNPRIFAGSRRKDMRKISALRSASDWRDCCNAESPSKADPRSLAFKRLMDNLQKQVESKRKQMRDNKRTLKMQATLGKYEASFKRERYKKQKKNDAREELAVHRNSKKDSQDSKTVVTSNVVEKDQVLPTPANTRSSTSPARIKAQLLPPSSVRMAETNTLRSNVPLNQPKESHKQCSKQSSNDKIQGDRKYHQLSSQYPAHNPNSQAGLPPIQHGEMTKKITGALKSLGVYLKSTGRQLIGKETQNFLLRIGDQHVLVSVPPKNASMKTSVLATAHPAGPQHQESCRPLADSQKTSASSSNSLSSKNVKSSEANSSFATFVKRAPILKRKIECTAQTASEPNRSEKSQAAASCAMPKVPRLDSVPGLTTYKPILPKPQNSTTPTPDTNGENLKKDSNIRNLLNKDQSEEEFSHTGKSDARLESRSVVSSLPETRCELSNPTVTLNPESHIQERDGSLCRGQENLTNSNMPDNLSTAETGMGGRASVVSNSPGRANKHLKYADPTSVLAHFPPDSRLLPTPKRDSLNQLSDTERTLRREMLEKKYPLPPGVVIKTELSESDTAMEFTDSVTPGYSEVTPLRDNIPTQGSGLRKHQENQGSMHSHGDMLTTRVSNTSPTFSTSMSLELGYDLGDHMVDEPPPLIERAPRQLRKRKRRSRPSRTKNNRLETSDEQPPVLLPMCSPSPTTQLTLTSSAPEEIADASHTTEKVLYGQSNMTPVLAHYPVTNLASTNDIPSSSEPSSSAEFRSESEKHVVNASAGNDCSLPAPGPSSGVDSSPSLSAPVQGFRATQVSGSKNVRIQRLKELLKKKEQEIETMRKVRSELPQLWLDNE
ncbi:hypothetical protein PoB_002546800 [Plakobranchus ocellatus]|uniref:Uncharacterized protein n=1 Tax=Plakobranchus ocellatus TaxID=259542 RepID=A0AAV3ZX34_9GAST|nr:hypothetical protein PoB_002546800 [Plakobranchus ocellatus]